MSSSSSTFHLLCPRIKKYDDARHHVQIGSVCLIISFIVMISIYNSLSAIGNRNQNTFCIYRRYIIGELYG